MCAKCKGSFDKIGNLAYELVKEMTHAAVRMREIDGNLNISLDEDAVKEILKVLETVKKYIEISSKRKEEDKEDDVKHQH